MTAAQTAWQAALTAERAAIYGYGVVGPRVTGAEQQQARDFERQHRVQQEETVAAMSRAGVTPAVAQPAYPPAQSVTDAASARRLAVTLESDAAAAWRFVVANAPPGDPAREGAQAALTACAVRAATWRMTLTPDGPFVPFPGV